MSASPDGAAPTASRPPNVVRAEWAGEHRFDTVRGSGGPMMRLDSAAITGITPPDALLGALAACAGMDVVDIMAKRRTPLSRFAIEVEGHRRSEQPRRFERMTLVFDMEGEGVERAHAERAVHLAFEKYCTVAASLAPDLQVETVVVLAGERGAPVGQVIFSPG